MPRLGICFTGQPYSLREVIAAARQAERLGYDSVWVAEDVWTGRDAITVLTAIALNTERVRIGTCLVGATTRHPVLTAMTFNTLREVAPGRLVLGLGYASGWLPTLSVQQEAHDASPLRTMREAVTTVRSLLAGGEAPWGGGARGMIVPRPWFDGIIESHREAVPVYMGAVGPKMTRLAGEVADGLLLEMELFRPFIPARLKEFHSGARSAGKDPARMEVVKLVLASVESARPVTRRGNASRPAHHNAMGWAAKSVALLDDKTVRSLDWDLSLVTRIKAAWAAGDWAKGKSQMTPDMVRAFVAAGSQEHVAEVIRETIATGVTLPVLIPYGGPLEPVLEAGAAYIKGLQQ